MNLCMRESTFIWKNSQAQLTSGAVHMGDQSWKEMAACSPCQSAWVNCQTLRLSENSHKDVYFHECMIRWTNWGRGRAGDICRKVSDHQIQKGGFSIGIDPGWKVHRLNQSSGITEVLCWSDMAGERYQQPAKLHGDNWNRHIWGRERVGTSG